MRAFVALSLVALTCVALASAAASAQKGGDDAGWQEASRQGSLVIYNRARPGSEVKEVRAVGVIDAPPWVVKNVIDDVRRYEEFMPFTEESTVFDEKPGSFVSYQKLEMPFISDRDYVIRIRDESKRLPDGRVVYKNAWSPAPGVGPKPKDGVVRLVVNEGYWRLEEHDGGKKTKATYYVFTDPGGSLPAFVVNAANNQAIPDLFKAVAGQTKDPRYTSTKPKLPGEDAQPAPAATPPSGAAAPAR